MKLYNFFRSGSSYRLRIALKLKGLAYDHVAVDLRREQHATAAFKALNPQGLVPALAHEGGVLIQSPAIIDAGCAAIDAFRLAAPALQPDAA